MKDRIHSVLVAPYVSEKSTMIAQKDKQIIFTVLKDATKLEIKKAIEALFNVKVATVNCLIQKGKQKTFGKIQGRRKDFKKAYITLEKGQDFDLASSV